MSQSHDPEAALVACAIANPAACDAMLESIRADQFGAPLYRSVYQAIQLLHAASQVVNAITVAAKHGMLPPLPPVDATVPETLSYVAAVRDAWMARRLLSASRETIGALSTPGYKVSSVLDDLAGALSALELDKSTDTLRPAGDVLVDALAAYRTAVPGTISGMPTGIDELDRALSGLRGGEVTVLAGRPGSGKSSAAFDIALNIAATGRGVIGFSLEMPSSLVTTRNACALSGVNFRRLRDGFADLADWAKINAAKAQMQSYPYWLDDRPGITFNEIRAKCRKVNHTLAKRGQRLHLVVIDYLQLAGMDDEKWGTEGAISRFTRDIKTLSKELDVAVLLLSQLNRGLESRDDKRPKLSDLRSSGAIEQDADTVVMIYRESMYREDAPHPWLAEFGIEKNRNAPLITCYAYFQAEVMKFRSLTEAERLAAQLPLLKKVSGMH